MTAHDLIEAFETLADAPDGVARLRELVLQLAVRGRLVPQDPEDEPASVLLERIAEEKPQAFGTTRRPPSIAPHDLPFECPDGWKWCRFAEVANIASNLVNPDGYQEWPHVAPNHIEKATGRLLPYSTVGDDAVRSSKHRFFAGQVLYSKIRPNLSKAVLVDFDGLCSADMYPLDPYIAPRYLHLFILSQPFLDFVAKDANRLAMPKVNQEQLSLVPFALPPLAEQRRIVARVDELMGLLDRLEAARNAREATRVALRDAALAALRDADDAEAVQVAWARIAEHMDELFTHPDDVAPLRQTILQLAVRGRLVPQDPDDEPARVLLERIAAEKARLVKEGKIRKRKLPSDTPMCELAELPTGWEWAHLGACLLDIEAGRSPSAQKRAKEGTEWGVLKVSACSWGTFRPRENKALPADVVPDFEFEVRSGDFIICRANTVDLVARGAVVAETPSRLMLSDKTLRLVPGTGMVSGYLRLANEGLQARAHYEMQATGTSASMRNVDQTTIWEAPIPVPPLAEQHRIVARVDELMSLCDALETRLAAADESRAALAAAAVHHMEA